jgi:hypothetical protein
VAGPTSRFDDEAVAHHLELLRSISAELTRQLGGTPASQASIRRPGTSSRVRAD